ncbi:jg22390 [Pararge aegeria aegeria]|uniref:Jg22390 protein n=1 Tax=Pararge aegeria aegeria TaxID=348720 RepID=A0A8S4QU24_9NEOP|nr:jg22390 [Pararge aegeria aegeria]
MVNYLETNRLLLSTHLYGFLKSRSTGDAVSNSVVEGPLENRPERVDRGLKGVENDKIVFLYGTTGESQDPPK